MQKDVKELLLNEWQLLGGVNAPKGSLKKLADKYDINDNTVRRWKAEHLKKQLDWFPAYLVYLYLFSFFIYLYKQ